MRKGRAKKREVLPDLKYSNKVVTKFINMMMVKGKRSLAERVVYRSFDILQEQTGKDALEAFQKAVDNVRPLLEVKARRVGGATYQVPVEVRTERSTNLALRWIRSFARQKKGKPMEERLASELIDAYKCTGAAVKKREDTHKMAEANKAFAHYRW